jgi:hypothetical protein
MKMKMIMLPEYKLYIFVDKIEYLLIKKTKETIEFWKLKIHFNSYDIDIYCDTEQDAILLADKIVKAINYD